MTIHEAQQRLLFQLYHVYDNREASNVADLVMEKITGWKKIDRIINKSVPLRESSIELLDRYTLELLANKPVQYVLNEAWFYGLKFFVDKNVLIPRPETEELVAWAVETIAKIPDSPSILDIGTGSGCIPVALKKQRPDAIICACDVSTEALNVAKRNAAENGTTIAFVEVDFVVESERKRLPLVDLIISNPPYIPYSDKLSMHPNVVEHEPHQALFVPNEDPLLFYREIARFSKDHLKKPGFIFMETHEKLAQKVHDLFKSSGFENIEIRKDLQGKDRMMKITVW